MYIIILISLLEKNGTFELSGIEWLQYKPQKTHKLIAFLINLEVCSWGTVVNKTL